MDLHQIGTGLGSYAHQEQQQQSSSSSSSRHYQQHHQLYNLLPPQPSYTWPRSREQPQQSNVKRESMGKHLDGSKSADDSMPSTSDFVKKLYKFVPVSFILFKYRFFLPIRCVGCWRILPFRMLYLGDRWAIVLLSRYSVFLISYYTILPYPFFE